MYNCFLNWLFQIGGTLPIVIKKKSGNNVEYKLQLIKGIAGLGGKLERQVHLVLNMSSHHSDFESISKVQNDTAD